MKRLNTLTFKQLRALEAVVKTGGITASAEILGLTPPAVHSQIKLLEANFECGMVRRDAQGTFVATQEGRALLAAHETALAAFTKAITGIDALAKGFAGRVVLGVVSTGKYFAPSIVAQLKRDYPEIEVVLQVGNRDRTIKDLDAGKIDLAIMGRPPRQPEVTAYSMGDHPHVLIAPPDHPLIGRNPVEAEDILKEHFIMREPGSGTRILAMRLLDRIGEGQDFTYTEMESNESIKQAVIAGLGIALISINTIIEELKSNRLRLVKADGLPVIRHWFILHKTQTDLNATACQVRDYIKHNGPRFLAADDISRVLA
jgi:DNA-binding transcriptional LysR family regulator